MPNSLGSSCTADVQGMDWKMSLAGFVFLFSPSLTVSTEVRAVGVEALGSLSDECSGVVGAVFFSCWQEPGVSAGNVSEGSSAAMCGTELCSRCRHLAGKLEPAPCRAS